MKTASSECLSEDKTVFIDIDMGFESVGGFLLTIGCGFHIVRGIGILGVFTLSIFIGSVVFGLNDGGINNTGVTVFDQDALGIELMIDVVE